MRTITAPKIAIEIAYPRFAFSARRSPAAVPRANVKRIAEIVVEVVGRGLPDGRAQDLDDSEEQSDLGHLVQHRAGEWPAGRHAAQDAPRNLAAT
jgi:hypothetical protein